MRDWITITDIGGGNPVRLQSSGVSAGWSVASGSTASVEVLADDLIRAGLGVRPKGKWFFWEDQDAGAMNGTVTDSQPNGDDTVEIAAGDWRTLFDARRLPRSKVSSFGYAGALALIAISNCQHDDYLWVENMTADEGGEPVELSWDGGDLSSALDQLASSTGQEYWIDPDTRDFFWQFRRGQDLTTRVELAYNRHIVAYTLPDSIAPIRNDLLAVPSNELYAVTQALAVFDDDSIERYGRRQGSKDYLTGVTESALRPVAMADVARMSQLGASIEATVVNSEYCWSKFREGDSISMLLPNISSRLSVRVMARALDTSTQLMRISGTVEAWREYP
jgi:hypothetical protein